MLPRDRQHVAEIGWPEAGTTRQRLPDSRGGTVELVGGDVQPVRDQTDPIDRLQPLRLPAPDVPPDGLTLHETLAAAEAAAGRGLRVVRVHKRRARYTVDGCAAERSNAAM